MAAEQELQRTQAALEEATQRTEAAEASLLMLQNTRRCQQVWRDTLQYKHV